MPAAWDTIVNVASVAPAVGGNTIEAGDTVATEAFEVAIAIGTVTPGAIVAEAIPGVTVTTAVEFGAMLNVVGLNTNAGSTSVTCVVMP